MATGSDFENSLRIEEEKENSIQEEEEPRFPSEAIASWGQDLEDTNPCALEDPAGKTQNGQIPLAPAIHQPPTVRCRLVLLRI